MIWNALYQFTSILIQWLALLRRLESEKDLEILILRHQLDILQRQQAKPIRPSRPDKFTLTLLTKQLKTTSKRTIRELGNTIVIVKPKTIFKWHQEMVRRKWSRYTKHKRGRPKTSPELRQLVLQMAQENVWGKERIADEIGKLGHDICPETVRNILKEHHIPPAPDRDPSPSWRHLMTHYSDQIIACDFFTIETIFLKTLYVLVFIEHGTRRVYFAGCTSKLIGRWVTQQARQMLWQLEDQGKKVKFLIRDNDKKYAKSFDNIFQSVGIEVIRTPFQAPNANAYTERWIRTVRNDCTDNILIINQQHLKQVLKEYIEYYNTRRPHQGLDHQSPIPHTIPKPIGQVKSKKVLGGIINDYYRHAA